MTEDGFDLPEGARGDLDEERIWGRARAPWTALFDDLSEDADPEAAMAAYSLVLSAVVYQLGGVVSVTPRALREVENLRRTVEIDGSLRLEADDGSDRDEMLAEEVCPTCGGHDGPRIWAWDGRWTTREGTPNAGNYCRNPWHDR